MSNYNNPMGGHYNPSSPQSPMSPAYPGSPLLPASPDAPQSHDMQDQPGYYPPQPQQQTYIVPPTSQVPLSAEDRCTYLCGSCKKLSAISIKDPEFVCKNCNGQILFKIRTEASIQYEAR